MPSIRARATSSRCATSAALPSRRQAPPLASPRRRSSGNGAWPAYGCCESLTGRAKWARVSLVTPEDWDKVDAVLADALELGAGDREAFLSQALAGRDDLIREARALLAYDNGHGDP